MGACVLNISSEIFIDDASPMPERGLVTETLHASSLAGHVVPANAARATFWNGGGTATAAVHLAGSGALRQVETYRGVAW
jgi:hypothetical protein